MTTNYNLTEDPIPILIRRLAIPAGVGFLFHTFFNIVDNFYGGMISTDALAALSISFPVFFIVISISSGTGTGATALIANALGAGERERAVRLVAQSLSFGLTLAVLVTLVGWWVSPWLFRMLGASGVYLDLALQYMNVVFGGTIFFILANTLNAPLTSVGDTRTFRNMLIFAGLANVALDPWMIFGGFGVPAMGFAGIAWSTILIEAVCCLYIGYKASRTGLLCPACLKRMWPHAATMKALAANILPATFNLLTVGIGFFVIIYFVSRFGKGAVASYGISMRMEQIVLLPAIGLNMATISIVGQNFGAQNWSRVRETIFTSIRYGAIILGVGGVFMFVLAKPLVGLFTDDPDVIVMGRQYLQIASVALWAYLILFVMVSALQGMRDPMYAVWLGICRQIVAPVCIFSLFTKVFGWGLISIYWGFFLITWSAALFTWFYTQRRLKKAPTSSLPSSPRTSTRRS